MVGASHVAIDPPLPLPLPPLPLPPLPVMLLPPEPLVLPPLPELEPPEPVLLPGGGKSPSSEPGQPASTESDARAREKTTAARAGTRAVEVEVEFDCGIEGATGCFTCPPGKLRISRKMLGGNLRKWNKVKQNHRFIGSCTQIK